MSARFLGIGLLSLGGLVAGATGGYLALKTGDLLRPKS